MRKFNAQEIEHEGAHLDRIGEQGFSSKLAEEGTRLEKQSGALLLPFPETPQTPDAAKWNGHRLLERHQVLPGEGIIADLSTRKGLLSQGLTVLDISSMGMAVQLDARDPLVAQMKQGSHLYVHLRLGHGHSEFELKAEVRYIMPSAKAGFLRIGLRTFENPQHENQDETFGGYRIPENSPLPGFVYKGYFYYEKSIIKIISVARSSLIIEAYDPSLLVIPGMNLAVHLFLPHAEGNRIECKVDSILCIRDKAMVIRLIPKRYVGHTQEWIGRFLVQHAGFSPALLANLGFKAKNVSDALRVRGIRTNEEYLRVLELRRAAYERAGKLAPGTRPEDTASPLDPISTILVAIHGDKIVGSVTVTLPESEDLLLDTEAPFKEGYPKGFPGKKNLVELSRLCIDRSYQGSDTLIRLFTHICRVGMISQRTHMVTSTDDRLWPMYRKLGFQKVGLSYPHPRLEGKIHHLIILTREGFVTGKGIGPFVWYKVFRKMYAYLRDYGVIDEPPTLKIRFYTFLGNFIGPLDKLLTRRAARKSQRK